MKNVTITLDEETARWARVEAARRSTSMSRLVGAVLREHMRGEERYTAAMECFLSRPPRQFTGGERYPRREELHERADLR